MTKWEQLRLQVLERDQHTCQRCFDITKKVEIHHKIPRKLGGIDSSENLISYCRKCHKIVEPSHIGKLSVKITKTVRINDSIHKELKALASYDDTLDDVVARLIKEYQN